MTKLIVAFCDFADATKKLNECVGIEDCKMKQIALRAGGGADMVISWIFCPQNRSAYHVSKCGQKLKKMVNFPTYLGTKVNRSTVPFFLDGSRC